jgi:hypothetical protein
VIQLKYQESERGCLSSDRLKKSYIFIGVYKKRIFFLKFVNTSKKFNNDLSLLSLYLRLELRGYSNGIFYINAHLRIFISTLA